jgi:hypothetical protein
MDEWEKLFKSRFPNQKQEENHINARNTPKNESKQKLQQFGQQKQHVPTIVWKLFYFLLFAPLFTNPFFPLPVELVDCGKFSLTITKISPAKFPEALPRHQFHLINSRAGEIGWETWAIGSQPPLQVGQLLCAELQVVHSHGKVISSSI